MKKLSIDLKKFKAAGILLSKIPQVLASHAFIVIMALAFVAVLSGAFMFYTYASITGQELPARKNSFEFRSDVYQRVVLQLQLNEEKNKELDQEKYYNPFQH